MEFFASSRHPRTRLYLRVFSIIFLVIILLIAGWYAWSSWDTAAHGVEADGAVVERTEDDSGDPTLLVAYDTADGQGIVATLTGFVTSGKPRYDANLDVGDAVRIRYVPRDPRLVRLAAEPAVEPTPFYYFGFFLLLGIGLVVYAWWPGVSRGRRGASGGGPPPQ